MIRKYVEKVLERDAKQTPFRYIESEKKIKCLFPLTDKSNIQLKGFIDRIDEVRDVVRIIDYKSGGGTTQFTSVEALFDKADTDRSKAVMQVFMYAWMYNRSAFNCYSAGYLLYEDPLFFLFRSWNLPSYRPVQNRTGFGLRQLSHGF